MSKRKPKVAFGPVIHHPHGHLFALDELDQGLIRAGLEWLARDTAQNPANRKRLKKLMEVFRG